MKKLYLICTLILFQIGVWASEAYVSLTTSPKSFSAVSTLSTEDFSYVLSLSRPSEFFTVSAPATLSFYSQGWFVGEIRKSGLLNFIESPTEKSFSAYDTKPFQKVVTPSLNPTYAGLAKSFKNADFAVFSPIFSPTSQSGFFFDLNLRHLYCGSLFTNYNEKTISQLEVDWGALKNIGKNLFTIAGINDSLSRGAVKMDVSSFVQLVYRETYGLTGMLGYNLGFSVKDNTVSVYRRISNNTSSIPMDEVGYSVNFDDITVGYSLENYCKPFYGGTNQKKVAKYYSKFTYGNLTFLISSQLTAEIDTGKTATTSYELDYTQGIDQINAKIDLYRSKDEGISIYNLDISAKLGESKFCIENAKYGVTVGLNDNIKIINQIVNVKLSVTQDRVYSASLKLLL